ncbi:16S rRNA (cytidine(1402)-2'-O)-methyltransferase [Nitrincola tapanii]|uniref:Ribosomal RNA small subunit methyltransferase I n=1 Tax=Nitrincola tapanii TaxID=1708751 RepID=A0A5A9W0A7_9GAMM|nr:16S rRNA (cytidine(1402)-2'-O)-methyltransferase [Nitrincola tapanii]KAA0873924.1 16S rRNA (cytidine(1402)-2'-O)-methyltransferase [Nitrincola tapanii]
MSEPVLYVIATPIGNLNDLSPRAIKVLGSVDLIAAEDTRHTGRLLAQFSIKAPMISVHEHNETQRTELILHKLAEGQSVALVSDAGTPLISDPGYPLVRAVRAAGFKVSPIPGCCAFVAALSVSGLPSDRFMFCGFLPSKASARERILQEWVGFTATLIFYESTHRILDSLASMLKVFGPEREAVVARELTKTFETIRGGCLQDLLTWMQADPNQQKGEFVVLIQGAPSTEVEQLVDEHSLKILQRLAQELPPKKAAAITAEITGVNKKLLYESLLQK